MSDRELDLLDKISDLQMNLKMSKDCSKELREEISRLQAENERLQEDSDLAVKVWCVKLKDQLSTAEQRVARECAEIADNFDSGCCRENQDTYEWICGSIAKEIKSRYHLEETDG